MITRWNETWIELVQEESIACGLVEIWNLPPNRTVEWYVYSHDTNLPGHQDLPLNWTF